MKLSIRISLFLLWSTLLGAGSLTLLLAALFLYLNPQLPEVETLRDIHFQTPLRVYSEDGKLIGEFGEKRRTPIDYDDIPQHFIDAILAAEDDQFYSHAGVDIPGLARASLQLLASGNIQSGGSTITMQVARNFFLSRRQTFARKFNEILLALKIERSLTKAEILELYVNVIFLGNRAYGIYAASEVYYGKPIQQLTLAQQAMIAGLPKAPSIFNPIVNPERALTRRNWILGRMHKLELISTDDYSNAINEPVTAKVHASPIELDAPYVAEMARSHAVEKFGQKAYTEGYRVYTTIQSDLQASAQNALVKGLLTYDSRHGYRGAEANWYNKPEAPVLQVDPIAHLNQAQTVSEETQQQWVNDLKSVPTYHALLPAVVTAIDPENNVSFLLGNNTRAQLFWEQGLNQTRQYITESRRSAPYKSATDFLNIGDLIRVTFDESNGWQLSQIPAAQSALVALNSENGAIISLTGGFDFRYSNFNRATQALRQPGSNFKPFIYTAALENGLTPASIINDAPIVFDDAELETTWRPENDSGKFYGPTRLRRALFLSRNLVSIRVLRQIGVERAINTLEKFGFKKEELPRDLSLSLGSHAVTPLDVAKGYAVFANGGYAVEPFFVSRIDNNSGETLYRATPLTACKDCETLANPERARETDTPSLATSNDEVFVKLGEEDSAFLKPHFDLNFEAKQLSGTLTAADYPRAPKVLDDRVNFIINDMLQDVITRGTGRKARALERSDLAGKTGTTNGPTDAWFSGYHPKIVATTWVGFDQNTKLGRNEYGGSAALPIWIDFMRDALKSVSEYKFSQPEGVVMVKIDPETGARAKPGDLDAIFEIFREENLPEEPTEAATDIWNESQTTTEEIF